MKQNLKSTGLAALVLAFGFSSLAQNNITGKWASQFDSQIGTQKYTFDLKMDGTNLVGRAVGERTDATNEVAITNGRIDGDKISFSEPVKIQDNDVVVEYSGTIAGDELKLHRKVGDFAEYDIVAKRVAAATAAAGASPLSGSITGKWQGQFDSQIGVQKYTYNFTVNGTNLTGRAVGIRDGETNSGTNDVAITEGSITPDGISFVEPFKFNDQDIRIEYTGKISGAEIKLHRKVGDVAEEDLTVKRVQPANP
jgi:hypothetical protein